MTKIKNLIKCVVVCVLGLIIMLYVYYNILDLKLDSSSYLLGCLASTLCGVVGSYYGGKTSREEFDK